MRFHPLRVVYFAVAGSVMAAASAAWAATPINLLPLGDSITAQGYYISPLTTLLTNNGYSPTLIANEGHSGFIIDGSITGAPRSGLSENTQQGGLEGSPTGTDFLNHPNTNAANTYILLMIGTNDVDTGFDLTTGMTDATHGNIVVDPAARINRLISDVRIEDPLAHLIVAKIVPNLGSGKDAAVQAFNSAIAGVVNGLNDSHVTLVDMYSAFQPNPSPLMADNLHPNQSGGNVMANVWYAGIRAVPEPPSAALLILGTIGLVVLARRRGA